MKMKLIDATNEKCDNDYYPIAGNTYTHPYISPEKIEKQNNISLSDIVKHETSMYPNE